MRLSTLFGRTQRENPSDAQMVSHQLSIRAGLIRQVAQGIYAYLPLGWRTLRKIEGIVRQEMDAIGGQELSLPIVQPAELWQASGRYDAPSPGPALLRFKDRSGHDLVLAMTHEEAVTDLARQLIHSYRQLPLLVYQIQCKFRDEPRSRGGLVRVREFIMKDAYSFAPDQASLDLIYAQVFQAYLKTLARCGLQTLPVQAASGMMGGSASHEFMVVNERGEDSLILCPNCGYAANAEAATLAKGKEVAPSDAFPERVYTPGAKTIEGVARLLGVETRDTLKAVFYSAPEGSIILALIRGDLEVNEAKLANVLGGTRLEPASEEALNTGGIVAGYASPVGVSCVRVIADDSIHTASAFVAGANEPDYHLRNVAYPRDFRVDIIADIALARDGDPCSSCGFPLTAARGIEVGHVFKLGTKYSQALGAAYLDQDGTGTPLVMGSYGLGLGRLLACVIEQHHDDKGIVWPVDVAPFQVHLVSLGDPASDVGASAEALYGRLRSGGYEVLYDDRDERAGIKFNDADLIGIPVRLTVSRRTLEERGVEIKARWEAARRLVADDELESAIDQTLSTAPRMASGAA